MERGMERYMIMYAWQMLEGNKTDVLGLKTKLSNTNHNRSKQLGGMKKYRNDDRVFMIFPTILEPTRVASVQRKCEYVTTESLTDNIFINIRI